MNKGECTHSSRSLSLKRTVGCFLQVATSLQAMYVISGAVEYLKELAYDAHKELAPKTGVNP